jgi:NADPH:quinone reductase-like Zn-dependent oxidoreductase
MKAVVHDEYGPPGQVLRVEQVDTPAVGHGDLLVRVRGASVNPGDLAVVTGQPTVMRLMTGLRRPGHRVPGMDFAGVVEQVGADVTGVRVGDEVCGEATHTFAEFAVVRPDQVSRKPAGLSFPHAATLPVAGLVAWQALQKAVVGEGVRVLVNGASGGVGHFAVQIAAAAGAQVTGVCSGRNADLVAGLGAHEVLDYTHTDYTTAGLEYDVVFDAVRSHPLGQVRRALAPGGTYLAVGTTADRRPGEAGFLGPLPQIARGALQGLVIRRHRIVTVSEQPNRGIERLTALVDAGRVTPHVEQTYPLDEVPAALSRVATMRVRGKIAIAV